MTFEVIIINIISIIVITFCLVIQGFVLMRVLKKIDQIDTVLKLFEKEVYDEIDLITKYCQRMREEDDLK